MTSSDNSEPLINNLSPSQQDQKHLLSEARIHYKKKRYDEALVTCEKALQLDATNPILHQARGSVLFCLERYYEALLEFMQSLELEPDDPAVYLSKGHTLFALNRYAEAIETYEQVLKVDPNNTVANNGKNLAIKRESEVLETQVNILLILENKDQLIYPDRPIYYPYNTYSLTAVAVNWSSKGLYVACVLPHQVIQVWEVISEKSIVTYNGHDYFDDPCSLVWSPDGTLIASIGQWGAIHIWNALSANCNLFFKGNHENTHNVTWSPDSKYLVTDTSIIDFAPPIDTPARKIGIWSVAPRRNMKSPPSSISKDNFFIYRKGEGIPIWSPDGKYFATNELKGIRVWEAISGKTCCQYEGRSHLVAKIVWSPNGTYIASSSLDKTIHIWNASTAKPVLIFTKSTHIVSEFAWSSDGKYIASSDRQNVQVWEVSSGELIYTYRGHSDWILKLAWSPDNNQIVSICQDFSIHLWKIDR